jgi:hypothetical protein
MGKASLKSSREKAQEIAILREQIKVMKDAGGSLSLVPTPISKPQILTMLQRTPKNHIYTRPAKGGGEWEYVTGTYVKKVLNYVFGWLWDFQIVDKGREGDQVWLQGRLTVHLTDEKGVSQAVIKEQFGRADVKLKKGTQTPLDYGNDLKAAATDALKKCAAELGIASDIYGKGEFKEIRGEKVREEIIARSNDEPAEVKPPTAEVTKYFCSACDVEIDEITHKFSTKLYGQPLCRGDQKTYKKPEAGSGASLTNSV